MSVSYSTHHMLAEAMAPKTLHNIHKRPAAKAALKRLLVRKKPATGVKLSLDILDQSCTWPVFGLPEYSFLKVSSGELSKAGFYGITYLVCKNSKSTQQRKDREPFLDPLRLDINKEDGRLSVNACLNQSRKRRVYTRLLGLSFLYSCWDDNGKLLASPRFLGSCSFSHMVYWNFSLSCLLVEVWAPKGQNLFLLLLDAAKAGEARGG